MVAQDAQDAPSDTPSPSQPDSAPKGRSCRGFLYHSSQRRAKARKPLCVGFSRPEQRVHDYSAGDAERDATKDGRALLDFKYMCMGYSAHRDMAATNSGNVSQKQAELPLCMGFELLAEKRAPQGTTTAGQEHAPQNIGQRNNEGASALPRPTSPIRSPTTIGGYSAEEFSSRFVRNAGLIAAAVGNNLTRVATSIKSGLDDIFYPDRRRPK